MELREVKISEIEFGERFRKEYENVPQLAESIRDQGIIHPISISLNPNSNGSGKPYLLTTGGRRYKAYEYLIKSGHSQYEIIPTCFYDKVLTELESRSLEAAENIERENFTYAEEVSILKRVHDLQLSIHGEKLARSCDATGWSKADTAKLVSKSPATISQDLELAEAIEAYPELELGKCKNKSEARKRLKQAQSLVAAQQLAQQYAKQLDNSDSTKQKLIRSYMLQDFFDGVKKIPDATIDLVEIDPPYAINLKENKKNNECLSYNEIDEAKYLDFINDTLKECYRVMKPNRWLILWFAPEPWFELMYQALINNGFNTHRMVGIWTKTQGQTNQPLKRLANAYEMFFYASKGNARLAKPGMTNQFAYPPVPHTKKVHPTERPTELIQDILQTFAKPDSKVLVPFLGSGQTILAAHRTNMTAFGFELSRMYQDSFIIKVNEEID
jgi:site-specific DNA-methyltransferase (adenine-specific)